jgi:transcription elongation factor S-II
MRGIENPKEFRENIRNQLKKIVLKNSYAINIEKGVYNYSIRKATEKNVVKKWENIYFTMIYIDRLRSVWINLKNPSLLERLHNKELKAHEIGYMSHQDMIPSKWEELLRNKKERDENKYSPQLVGNTDNYTCRKCKSKNCSYYQLQTRSADEPMTNYFQCLNCGNRWKT